MDSNVLRETVVYAARIKNNAILNKSSSGGMFSAFSNYFLDKGHAVVCVVYNYENNKAEYKLLQSKHERDLAIGSKYMQSYLGDIFKISEKWLQNNPEKKLVFFGMGCQVDGFRKYIEIKKIRDRVTLIDIICHGLSSSILWEDYLKLYKKDCIISNLNFRDKRQGWRKPTPVLQLDSREKNIQDYLDVFYNKCSLKPACYKCPYSSTSRKVDVTIGDYWGIENEIPEFYDSIGNSVVLIYTQKGLELFNNIIPTIDYTESNIKKCLQPNLIRPTDRPLNRDEFWVVYHKKGLNHIIKTIKKVKRRKQVISKLRNIKRKSNVILRKV